MRFYKLNVDGGSAGNLWPSGGGGGVVWDHHSRVLVGFARHYGHAANTLSECRALLDGLKMCRNLGLRNILVELDSKVVVGWFLSGVCRFWYLWEFWEEVQELVSLLNTKVQHVFHEANMVAVFLAKEGTRAVSLDFSEENDESGWFQGLVRINRWGLPYFRA